MAAAGSAARGRGPAALAVLAAGALTAGALASDGLRSAPEARSAAAALGARLLRVEAACVANAARASAPEADPVRILRLPGDRRVVVLRGTSEVLLTDGLLRVLDRAPGPRGACGAALLGARVVVCGELSGRLTQFDVRGDQLVSAGEMAPGVVSGRDLASRGDRLYLIDRFDRQLVEIAPGRVRRWAIGPGADRVFVAGDYLVINLVLAHQVLVLPLGADGPEPRQAVTLGHSGPVWSVAAVPVDGGLRVVAGGVEDFPLDRTAGEFDHMDSYLHVHEITRDRGVISGKSINLSQHGVLTPRALAFDPADQRTIWVAGSGSRTLARVRLDAGVQAVHAIGPGVTDLSVTSGRVEMASALADSVWAFEPGRGTLAELALARGADPRARLGEYLVFTDMMSPGNVSEGARSRLTCEACHFEGDGDGRVHFTGRGTVRLTPKSIRGLLDNVPLFSRAGDPSLATMTLAEFRVANQGRRATFDVNAAAWPGLGRVGAIGPTEQREAFLTFLARYRHRPNPQALASPIGALASAGLAVFRQRCADCHQARTSTREPATFVPFERWAESLEGKGPEAVWGASFMAKTGLEPYPSTRGTRVPSLRRIWTKYPYFSDGSSGSLAAALARFRHRGGRSWHHYQEGGPAPAALTPSEIEALLAALRYF